MKKHLLSLLTRRRKNGVRCNSSSMNVTKSIVQHQNKLFDAESKRQIEAIGRIEKITVAYKGPPKDCTLIMNKNISTPYNCAQHMVEMLVRRSALALIDGTQHWDMHRPLENDCELQLLHFQDENPAIVNKAFWRSCSVMLGAVASTAFKEHVPVILHSFPKPTGNNNIFDGVVKMRAICPNVRSGSFVYDVELPTLDNWEPNSNEMKVLSSEMVKLSQKNIPIERLAVSAKIAAEIFQCNKYKMEQIPKISEAYSDHKIVLYRIGEHIDISRGPLIGSTGLLGRCTITSVHKLKTNLGNFYRFQGVALPKGIMMNHFAYSILEKRALNLNQGRLPWEYETDVFQPELQAMEATA